MAGELPEFFWINLFFQGSSCGLVMTEKVLRQMFCLCDGNLD